ncbi:DUF2066 domain-containing protein [Emcibacter sp.]|uniref:DUF2066 domain-containing protein n=1 Tax=Emcibacter sp. TaxID=1979954 RepID=UPI002AA7ACC7|nr:DUF2066 domain-containing protein [Emcibacter sp.]
MSATPEREARIYTIYDTMVDQTSRTVNEARRVALLNGQREALQKLFEKILRPEDLTKLPYFDDRQVRELISGFEIMNERNSSVRYIATLTVHFSREKIYDILALLQIPFAESLSSPVTILPVLEKDGSYFLWEKDNGWKAHWEQFEGLNNLVPPVVPPSDISSQLLINSWQAYDGLEVKIRDYARKEHLDDLVIAIASLERDLVSDHYRLALSLRQGLGGQIVYKNNLSSELGEDALPQDVLNDLYERAVNATMIYLDNQWREKVLVQFGVASRVKVTVRISGLEDWVKIQERLRSVSLIRDFTVDSLALDHASLTIDHSGDLNQLFLTMTQQGFSFETYWKTPQESLRATGEIYITLERGQP